MNQIARATTSLFFALGAILGLQACSTSSGGGGGGYYIVGGAAGTVCYPATQNEGCFANARVKCDVESQKWTQIAPCNSGETCGTVGDGAGKMLSQCTASSTNTGGSGSDASTTKDTTVADVSVVKDTSTGTKTDTTVGTKDTGTKVGCGDGVCGAGETSANCPADCGATNAECCAAKGAKCGFVSGCPSSCGSCPTGKTCSSNQCVGGGGSDAGSSDAGSSGNCVEEQCGTEWQGCLDNAGCVGVLLYLQFSACAQDNNCSDANCAQQFCSKQISDCQNDANCGAFAQCLNGCGQNDDACVDACVAKTGGTAFQSLSDCANTNCP